MTINKTMKENIRIHAEIEAENKRKLKEWYEETLWLEKTSVEEIRKEVEEMDAAMDWGEGFSYMLGMLNAKIAMIDKEVKFSA